MPPKKTKVAHADKVKSKNTGIVKSSKPDLAKSSTTPASLFSLNFKGNVKSWIEGVDADYQKYVNHALEHGRGGSLSFTELFDSKEQYQAFQTKKLEDLAKILNDEMYKQLVDVAGYTKEELTDHLKVVCENGKLSLFVHEDLQNLPDVKNLQEKMNQYFDIMNPQIIDAVFSDKAAVHQNKDAQIMESRIRVVMQAALVALVVVLILAAIITALYFAAPAICTALGIGAATTVTTATSAVTAAVVTSTTAVAKEVREHSKLKLLMDHAVSEGKNWVTSDAGKDVIVGAAKEHLLPEVTKGAKKGAEGVVGLAAKLASKYMLSFDKISDYDKVVKAQAGYDDHLAKTAAIMKKHLESPGADSLKTLKTRFKMLNYHGRFDEKNPIHANLQKIVNAAKENKPLNQVIKDQIVKELDEHLKHQKAVKDEAQKLKADVAKGVSNILSQVSAKVRETTPEFKAEKAANIAAIDELLKLEMKGIKMPSGAASFLYNFYKDGNQQALADLRKWHKMPNGNDKDKLFAEIHEGYLEIADEFSVGVEGLMKLEVAASKGKELAGVGVQP